MAPQKPRKLRTRLANQVARDQLVPHPQPRAVSPEIESPPPSSAQAIPDEDRASSSTHIFSGGPSQSNVQMDIEEQPPTPASQLTPISLIRPVLNYIGGFLSMGWPRRVERISEVQEEPELLNPASNVEPNGSPEANDIGSTGAPTTDSSATSPRRQAPKKPSQPTGFSALPESSSRGGSGTSIQAGSEGPSTQSRPSFTQSEWRGPFQTPGLFPYPGQGTSGPSQCFSSSMTATPEPSWILQPFFNKLRQVMPTKRSGREALLDSDNHPNRNEAKRARTNEGMDVNMNVDSDDVENSVGFVEPEDIALPSIEEWHQAMKATGRVGNRGFVEILIKESERFLDNKCLKVSVHQNGRNFRTDLKHLDHPHLYHSIEGFGMTFPKDFGFSTLGKYLNPNSRAYLFDSDEQATVPPIPMGDFLEMFETPEDERPKIYNLLSLELNESMEKLASKFSVPTIVAEKDIVGKVEKLFKNICEDIEEEVKRNPDDREDLEEKLDKFRRRLSTMPHQSQYLIVSMGGAFTGNHIDLGGACTYFYVHVGVKIFFLAPPTKKNLRIFKEVTECSAEETEKKEWLIIQLQEEWRRVVINAGEMAMIPGGWIHFVYTPVDSIVFTGSFLMEDKMDIQFEVSESEEKALPHHENAFHTFVGFRNVMWAFAEHDLIPKLRNLKTVDAKDPLLRKCRLFLENMDAGHRLPMFHETDVQWYTRPEKEEILRSMETMLMQKMETRKIRGTE